MEPVILLHGAIGASDQLDNLAENLKADFNIHLLNFSGHGGKPFTKEFSISLFAEEVLQYLDQNKIEKASSFGYSMGGYVAMYLAKYHPSRIAKVITLATKFQWDETIAGREIKMLNAETIEQKLPDFASQLKERHHPNDWKEVLAETRNMLISLGKQNALQVEDYKTISNQCLLLIGDSDKMVSVDETIAVFDVLLNARLKILPETFHPIEQVDVKLLSNLIRKFINSGE